MYMASNKLDKLIAKYTKQMKDSRKVVMYGKISFDTYEEDDYNGTFIYIDPETEFERCLVKVYIKELSILAKRMQHECGLVELREKEVTIISKSVYNRVIKELPIIFEKDPCITVIGFKKMLSKLMDEVANNGYFDRNNW